MEVCLTLNVLERIASLVLSFVKIAVVHLRAVKKVAVVGTKGISDINLINYLE